MQLENICSSLPTGRIKKSDDKKKSVTVKYKFRMQNIFIKKNQYKLSKFL